MEIKKLATEAKAIRFSVEENGAEVGRAFLYIVYNDLHDNPYGLVEDVYVEEDARGKGIGTDIINELISEAKRVGCYKLIATSRHQRKNIHVWYGKLGFEKYGHEFRMNL